MDGCLQDVATGAAAHPAAEGGGAGLAPSTSYAALLLAWCQDSEAAAAALASSPPQLSAVVQLIGRCLLSDTSVCFPLYCLTLTKHARRSMVGRRC